MLATSIFQIGIQAPGDTIPPVVKVQTEKTLDNEISRLSKKYEIKIASSTIKEIIKCESEMYGDVEPNVNKNGTTDHGWLQINTVHKPEMKKRGLDITNKWDSLEFGFILMERNGLSDWYSSKDCWLHKV